MTTRNLPQSAFTHLHGKEGEALHTLLQNMLARLDAVEDAADNILGKSLSLTAYVQAHNMPDETNYDSTYDIEVPYDYTELRDIAAELADTYTAHLTAGNTDEIHDADDATNVVTETNPPTTDTETDLLLNEVKALLLAHASEAGVHFKDVSLAGLLTADDAAGDGSDLDLAYALALDIKDTLLYHLNLGVGINRNTTAHDTILV